MKKINRRYDVNQCALYKCQTMGRLERVLKVENGMVSQIQEILTYHSFSIDKRGTEEKRLITAPDKQLKKIQSRILRMIERIERPKWLISGEKGKSYINNGEVHQFSKYVLTMDIKKFYNNCKREYAFRFFKDYLKAAGDIAGLLTDIVTFQGGIPTGCPTSQLIAYYAYQKMFYEINEIAIKHGCIFTLYVDDMTFSSKKPFMKNVLKNEVDVVLRKYGHKPKYCKVKYFSKDENKPITGTIVTPEHALRSSNRLQHNIYTGFKEIAECISKNLEIDKKDLLSLSGRLQASVNIEKGKFPEIRKFVKKVMLSKKTL